MSMSSTPSTLPTLGSQQQQQIASQTNFLTGQNDTMNPQNLYNQYSGLVFGNQPNTTPSTSPQSAQLSTMGIGNQNQPLPTHTEQVPAQVTDYSQLFNSLNQYLSSMNNLLSQYQQK